MVQNSQKEQICKLLEAAETVEREVAAEEQQQEETLTTQGIEHPHQALIKQYMPLPPSPPLQQSSIQIVDQDQTAVIGKKMTTNSDEDDGNAEDKNEELKVILQNDTEVQSCRDPLGMSLSEKKACCNSFIAPDAKSKINL